MDISLEEKGAVSTQQRFDNEPELSNDPLSWALWQKIYHTFIVAFIGFVVMIGDSIYIPAIPSIRYLFKTSETVALLPYSLYAFGQALGPVLAAPLSETFGRRAAYIPYLTAFMLFTMGAGLSNNITSLCVCRFFAGVMGSPTLSVGLGVIADIWEPKQRAIPTSIMIGLIFLAPSLGPLLGSRLVTAKSWRWTQWFLIFLSLLGCIFTMAMKETYRSILIAQQQRKAHTESVIPKSNFEAKTKLLLTSTIFRPWRLFFSEPIIFSFALLSGYDTAIYYALFAFFPYIFTHVYDLGLETQGLTFLGLGVGNVLGVLTVIALSSLSMRRTRKAMLNGETSQLVPEMRLIPGLLGSVFVPAGLFWIGWSSRGSIHPIVPICGSGVFAYGNFLIFMSYSGYVIDVYEARIGASATATVAMLRSVLGGIFPLFTNQMYEQLGVHWASSVFAFIALALSTVPWILYRHGAKLRQWSKNVQ